MENPFNQKNKIIITSYQFAAKHEEDLVKINRDAVVIDENSVPDIRSRLVLLSTCSYEKKDTRTVLVGVIKNN